jgi:hypothetical protein
MSTFDTAVKLYRDYDHDQFTELIITTSTDAVTTTHPYYKRLPNRDRHEALTTLPHYSSTSELAPDERNNLEVY